jgi:hypothetical protein
MGYGPQVGTSREGYPIYLYTDPRTNLRNYVVVLPDGRAFYSDAHGKIGAAPAEANKQVVLAFLGGIVGLAFGAGPGAILGALLGATVGNLLNKKGA